MFGELINVTTRDGKRLDGMFSKPAPESASRLAVDVMVLHHGVADNFYGPGIYDDFVDGLLEMGCAVLRVNNRGHDPVGQVVADDLRLRLGAAYEIVDECRFDWEAWVDFAQACGYSRVGLWGHSLGGVKSIYYMALQPDPRVNRVVAASPPVFSHSAYLQMAEGAEFESVLSQAQRYVDDGHPKTLMEVLQPYPLVIAAEVFVDKYGPHERYNILNHIPQVKVPILMTLGTQEPEAMMAFRDLPREMQRLSKVKEDLAFELIPGGDHYYTHQREYVWSVVSHWLEKEPHVS